MIKEKSVAVIGLGYVGLPLLRLLSNKKIKAYGFDINHEKISNLKKNISYISDLTNNQLKIIDKKKLFDMDEINKINECNFIVLCLPTPLNRFNEPDMEDVKLALDKMKPFLKKNQTIILESTVYPGATRDIFVKSLSKKFKLGRNFYLGYSSERISPGQTNRKNYKYFFENTTKVISGYDKKSLNKIKSLYSKVFDKLFAAESLEIAEMSKLVENSYRSVNIGLVNELKVICKKMNINVHKVIDTAGTKPFGFNRFYPGPGVGGHCIPIDPIFLKWSAKKRGVNAKFISLARLTNLKITDWLLKEICKNEPNTKKLNHKKKILIVGIAYKADVNDVRESPSIRILKYLLRYNNFVDFHDEKINEVKINNRLYKSVKLKNLKKYDYVIIGTNHSGLRKSLILKNAKKIFDSRGIFSRNKSKKVILV